LPALASWAGNLGDAPTPPDSSPGLQPRAKYRAPHVGIDLSRCRRSFFCLLTSPKVELAGVFWQASVAFSLDASTPVFFLSLFFCLCFLRRKKAKPGENYLA